MSRSGSKRHSLPNVWTHARAKVRIQPHPLTSHRLALMLETTAEIGCPYCGELITLFLDLSVESQTYIEDCSVCCQPMTVSYAVEDGELSSLSAEAAG